jgi:hypothetical protein
MTREQVSAAAEQARTLERLRLWASASDEDQAIIREIEQSHEEWLRIAVLMAVRRMTTYQLEGDPFALLQILAAGGRRRSTGLPGPTPAETPVRRRLAVPRPRSAALGR